MGLGKLFVKNVPNMVNGIQQGTKVVLRTRVKVAAWGALLSGIGVLGQRVSRAFNTNWSTAAIEGGDIALHKRIAAAFNSVKSEQYGAMKDIYDINPSLAMMKRMMLFGPMGGMMNNPLAMMNPAMMMYANPAMAYANPHMGAMMWGNMGYRPGIV